MATIFKKQIGEGRVLVQHVWHGMAQFLFYVFVKRMQHQLGLPTVPDCEGLTLIFMWSPDLPMLGQRYVPDWGLNSFSAHNVRRQKEQLLTCWGRWAYCRSTGQVVAPSASTYGMTRRNRWMDKAEPRALGGGYLSSRVPTCTSGIISCTWSWKTRTLESNSTYSTDIMDSTRTSLGTRASDKFHGCKVHQATDSPWTMCIHNRRSKSVPAKPWVARKMVPIWYVPPLMAISVLGLEWEFSFDQLICAVKATTFFVLWLQSFQASSYLLTWSSSNVPQAAQTSWNFCIFFPSPSATWRGCSQLWRDERNRMHIELVHLQVKLNVRMNFYEYILKQDHILETAKTFRMLSNK